MLPAEGQKASEVVDVPVDVVIPESALRGGVQVKPDLTLESYEACSVIIEPYRGEHQLGEIMEMIKETLSEPYSVYTYRYFINHCPSLCWIARDPDTKKAVGTIVSRLDKRDDVLRGYIAMLSVSQSHRKRGIGKLLLNLDIRIFFFNF